MHDTHLTYASNNIHSIQTSLNEDLENVHKWLKVRKTGQQEKRNLSCNIAATKLQHSCNIAANELNIDVARLTTC